MRLWFESIFGNISSIVMETVEMWLQGSVEMWPPRIPATMFLASAHPSHHVFQPPDFVLYLGPGPGEVLENQSVCSTHHIPDILTGYEPGFDAATIPRCYYIILLSYRLLSYLYLATTMSQRAVLDLFFKLSIRQLYEGNYFE